MSRTTDAVFHKEFRDMMNGRKAIAKNFNLIDLPLPNIPTMQVGQPKGHMAVVKNITEPFFDRLNNEEVQLVGRTTLQKRQVLSDGTFRKNKDDQYEYEQVPVPHTHVAILSKTSIGLRRYIEKDGVKIEHKVTEGFRYVDYVETKNGRRYIYIVPKDFVYRLNMSALIITPNKRRIFYQGAKLALQNGSYVYLYVIPYKYRDNADVRVLGIKSDTSFNQEVFQILAYWESIGVIFNRQLTRLDDNVNGLTNLGITEIEGTVVTEDYRRYTVSLAEEREEDFRDQLGVEG